MSRKEKVQTIVKVVISLVALAVVGAITYRFDFMPSLIFWFVVEIFMFADGCEIYNMLCCSGK